MVVVASDVVMVATVIVLECLRFCLSCANTLLFTSVQNKSNSVDVVSLHICLDGCTNGVNVVEGQFLFCWVCSPDRYFFSPLRHCAFLCFFAALFNFPCAHAPTGTLSVMKRHATLATESASAQSVDQCTCMRSLRLKMLGGGLWLMLFCLSALVVTA